MLALWCLCVSLALVWIPRVEAGFNVTATSFFAENVIRNDTVGIDNGTVQLTILLPFVNIWNRQRYNELVAGAALAVEDIQNDARVLANHTLKVRYAHSHFDREAAMWQVIQDSGYNGAVGPSSVNGGSLAFIGGLSPFVKDFAKACRRVNRLCVSPQTPVADPIRDVSIYPTMVNLFPSAGSDAKKIISVVECFGWTSVAVITSDDDVTLTFRDVLLSGLEAKQIKVTSNQVVLGSAALYTSQLQSIKDSRTRIIIFQASFATSSKLLKQAIDMGLFEATYTWVMARNANAMISGFADNLKAQVQGSLTIMPLVYDEASSRSQSLVARTEAVYGGFTTTERELFRPSPLNAVYNGVWLTAKAIQDLIDLKRSCRDDPSGARCAGLREAGDDLTLTQLLLNSSYPISNSTQVPISQTEGSQVDYQIMQRTAIDDRQIGTVYYNGTVTIDAVPSWPDGSSAVPSDQLNTRMTVLTESRAVVITMQTLAALMIAFIAFQAVAIQMTRKTAIVRVASPILVTVSFGGAIAMLTTVYFATRDTSLHCALLPALFHVGFTVFYGGLFLRSYRLYLIFRTKLTSLSSSHITSQRMFRFLVALTCVDVILLTLWFVVDAPQSQLHLVSSKPSPVETHVIEEEYVHFCTTSVFSTMLLVWKLLLLVFGVWVSSELGSVDLSLIGGGDISSVSMSIYTVAVVNFMLYICLNALKRGRIQARYTLIGGALLLQMVYPVLNLVLPRLYAVSQGRTELSDMSNNRRRSVRVVPINSVEASNSGSKPLRSTSGRQSHSMQPRANQSDISQRGLSELSQQRRGQSQRSRSSQRLVPTEALRSSNS